MLVHERHLSVLCAVSIVQVMEGSHTHIYSSHSFFWLAPLGGNEGMNRKTLQNWSCAIRSTIGVNEFQTYMTYV